jgi:hypothetical protein
MKHLLTWPWFAACGMAGWYIGNGPGVIGAVILGLMFYGRFLTLVGYRGTVSPLVAPSPGA